MKTPYWEYIDGVFTHVLKQENYHPESPFKNSWQFGQKAKECKVGDTLKAYIKETKEIVTLGRITGIVKVAPRGFTFVVEKL